MTVIFGATFVGGTVVGADRKRHHLQTLQSAGTIRKTVQLGSRAVAAKAGFGPSADHIWEQARLEIAGRDVDASAVAGILERLARPIFEECRRVGGPPVKDVPLQFVVGGLSGGVPTIHSIQIEIAERTDAEGPGKVMALGTRLQTNERAFELLKQDIQAEGSGLFVEVENWARAVVADELADGGSDKVGYPVDLSFVRKDSVDDRVLSEFDISTGTKVLLIET